AAAGDGVPGAAAAGELVERLVPAGQLRGGAGRGGTADEPAGERLIGARHTHGEQRGGESPGTAVPGLYPAATVPERAAHRLREGGESGRDARRPHGGALTTRPHIPRRRE